MRDDDGLSDQRQTSYLALCRYRGGGERMSRTVYLLSSLSFGALTLFGGRFLAIGSLLSFAMTTGKHGRRILVYFAGVTIARRRPRTTGIPRPWLPRSFSRFQYTQTAQQLRINVFHWDRCDFCQPTRSGTQIIITFQRGNAAISNLV